MTNDRLRHKLALVQVHLVGIATTNTSVNPARGISQAVFVAPLIGAAIAAVYGALRSPEPLISMKTAESALESEQA